MGGGKGVKEVVVVRVAAKGATKGDRKWGDIDVEEALVGSVSGGTWPEGWQAEVEVAAVVCECGTSMGVAQFVLTVLVVGEDFVWTTFVD